MPALTYCGFGIDTVLQAASCKRDVALWMLVTATRTPPQKANPPAAYTETVHKDAWKTTRRINCRDFQRPGPYAASDIKPNDSNRWV